MDGSLIKWSQLLAAQLPVAYCTGHLLAKVTQYLQSEIVADMPASYEANNQSVLHRTCADGSANGHLADSREQ